VESQRTAGADARESAGAPVCSGPGGCERVAGARAGVAVAYIVGAILLSAAARVMWMRAITVRPEA